MDLGKEISQMQSLNESANAWSCHRNHPSKKLENPSRSLPGIGSAASWNSSAHTNANARLQPIPLRFPSRWNLAPARPMQRRPKQARGAQTGPRVRLNPNTRKSLRFRPLPEAVTPSDPFPEVPTLRSQRIQSLVETYFGNVPRRGVEDLDSRPSTIR